MFVTAENCVRPLRRERLPKLLPGSLVLFVLAGFILAGCQSTLEIPGPASVAQHDTGLIGLSAVSIRERKTIDDSSLDRIAEDSLSDSTEFNNPIGLQNDVQPKPDDLRADAPVSADINGQPTRTLTLNEALRLAVANSEFIVDNASFLSATNPLLENPQFLQSTFDPDLQKSSQQSVDAALASFDTQLATGFQWGRNSVLLANSNLLSSSILINDNSSFYGRLDKPVLSGGTFSVIHNIDYATDSQSFPLDPRYNGFLRGEFRQPILAGRGRLFTEIAGPNSYRNRQQNQGIALAEITERTAEIDFGLGVERLVKQTEELYWDYWLALKVFENQDTAQKNANEIWMRIRNRAETGLAGGGAADEAQAEENYYRRKAIADSALVELEQASARLKHRIGLSDEAEVMLVTVDDPFDLPIVFELESSVSNGLNNRKELIKQDLQIQVIEYQLYAARQLKRPQLDLVSGVQLNGLGDDLFDSAGAIADLTELDDVGWNVGFEFSMPLGFNRERLNVRYLGLLLNKATTARKLQEKEIGHEIAYTAKSVEKWSQALTSAKRRLSSAERRLAAVAAEFQSGRASLDLFLRSQDSVADAHIEQARAAAELTKAQVELLFRQGLSKSSTPEAG